MKYIAVRKNFELNNHFDFKNYKFVFGDKHSKIVFEEINNIKAYLYDEISIESEVYINDGMFFQLLTLKMLKKGFKNIYIYEDKFFPEIVIKYNLNKFPSYLKKDNIIFIENYKQNSALLAYYLLKEQFDFIALKNIGDKIYEFSKILKEANLNSKIVLYGNTKTPKRDLMSNSVDVVVDDTLKNGICYDKNYSIKALNG